MTEEGTALHNSIHMPVGEEELDVMLIEPNTTLNTGNVRNERTVEVPEKV